MCLVVKVFDMVYLNGMSLIHKSVKFRKRNLKACVSEIKGRIEFVPESEGKTTKDVLAKLDEVMENRGEGLILKRPDAEYVLDGRNKDWIKVCAEINDIMNALNAISAGKTRVHGKRGAYTFTVT
jgi:DNA ligase 4